MLVSGKPFGEASGHREQDLSGICTVSEFQVSYFPVTGRSGAVLARGLAEFPVWVRSSFVVRAAQGRVLRGSTF